MFFLTLNNYGKHMIDIYILQLLGWISQENCILSSFDYACLRHIHKKGKFRLLLHICSSDAKIILLTILLNLIYQNERIIK